MGKISKKINKTPYQQARENLGLSREEASRLTGLEPSKIERIENEKLNKIDPYDVVLMQEAYKEPLLCNYYCTNECPIGIKYVAPISLYDFKEITLETLASINALQKRRDRIVEIARDGIVDSSELEDFVSIQNELEQISMAVEALQMWCEKMIAEGKINKLQYERIKGK